jgi:hypothetical protein
MKLRAPDGCTSVSHDGRTYSVAADGSLEVEDPIAAALAAHGFAPWRNEDRVASGVKVDGKSIAAPDIDSLNRPALFALLREKGVRVALPISNAELRAAARRALGVPRNENES